MIKALLVMTQPMLSTDVGPARSAVPHAVGAALPLLMEATPGQQEARQSPRRAAGWAHVCEEQDSRKILPPQLFRSVLLLVGRSKANINQMVRRVFPARRRTCSRRTQMKRSPDRRGETIVPVFSGNAWCSADRLLIPQSLTKVRGSCVETLGNTQKFVVLLTVTQGSKRLWLKLRE